MNEHKRELRHAAEEAFQESLERLQQTLAWSEKKTAQPDPPNEPHPIPIEGKAKPGRRSISLSELEDAVEDIEQFLQSFDSEPTHRKEKGDRQ